MPDKMTHEEFIDKYILRNEIIGECDALEYKKYLAKKHNCHWAQIWSVPDKGICIVRQTEDQTGFVQEWLT
jgi:hypothetical protein